MVTVDYHTVCGIQYKDRAELQKNGRGTINLTFELVEMAYLNGITEI